MLKRICLTIGLLWVIQSATAGELIYTPVNPSFGGSPQNIFETIQEAEEQAKSWLWTYNNDRPNMAIDEVIPAMKLKQAA